MITVSIIVPAYNEEKNFHKGRLDYLLKYLRKQKFSWEFIFVNDGSTDKTSALLKTLAKSQKGIKILDIQHGGKVAAVKAGVLSAKGKYVLFTDFDQSTPISEISQVLKNFKNGADIVIARKKDIYNWTLFKRLRSKIFNLTVQMVLLPGIRDTQCGFKAFKTADAKKIFNRLLITKKGQRGRFMGAFDVELLFIARKMGLKIQSIDVEWHYVESGRLALSEPIKMLLNVLLIRMYDLQGRYDRILNN